MCQPHRRIREGKGYLEKNNLNLQNEGDTLVHNSQIPSRPFERRKYKNHMAFLSPLSSSLPLPPIFSPLATLGSTLRSPSSVTLSAPGFYRPVSLGDSPLLTKKKNARAVSSLRYTMQIVVIRKSRSGNRKWEGYRKGMCLVGVGMYTGYTNEIVEQNDMVVKEAITAPRHLLAERRVLPMRVHKDF